MNRFAARVLIFLAIAVATSALLLDARVRANAPAGRYTVTGAGASAIVHDTKTNLTWQQTPASTLMSWANAKTYCGGVGSTLGGTAWRLPTVKELLTLVDYSRTFPAIDPTAFPGMLPAPFWSSTPEASSFTNVWGVDFGDGSTHTQNTGNTYDVRCVR